MYRMSSAGGLTPRVAVMGALRATSRQVHAGAAPTTTVLTKGYSPSSEVLLAAQAASSGGKVVVATQHLHPEDLAVQQKVLDLLAEPTNLSVTVVDERASWQPHRTTSAAAPSPSFEDSEASAAVLHEELASVAELIIARLAQDTAGQLGEMEVLQAERGKTLAELVMQCVHEEVQSVLAAVQGGGITSTTTDSAEVKERFIASVSDRVAALIATSTSTAQSAMTSIETQVQSLVTSMERFETTLVEQVRSSSLHQTESPALTAAVGGDDLRQLLIRVIEETSHKQQESLTARMEEVLHATTESMAHTTTTTTTTPDTSLADSLQGTIEGSVRAASDEMRLVLSREIKKLARTSKRGAAEDSSEDSAMTPEAESLLLTKMEELIHRSELLASRVDLSDERMHEVVEGHQGTKQAVLELRSLLEAKLLEVSAAQATAVPHTHDAAPPPPPSVDLTPVMAAVESLRTEVTRSSAQLDAMSSQAEARFLTAAQTIGDCVVDAVGKHSAEALSAALEHMNATLRQDVAHALEAHAQQQQPQQPTTQPAPGISVAEVASAVEAVMAPRLDALLARAEALAAQAPSSSINDQQLLAMASTITESMQDAMKTHFEHYGHARAAEEGGVSEQLASLRADVIAAVEAEMAKTHEVDLTPMYHYIDSMMAFVKEQLEARDKTLNTELAAATETITKATEASQAELLTSIKHMMEASAATAAATSQEKLQQQQQQEQRRRHEEEQAATHAAIDEVVRGALRKDVSAPMDLLSERLTAVDASSKAVHERLGELEATVVSAVADAKRAVDAARAAPPPQAAAAPASPQMDREAVHANLDSALSKAVAEMREALDGAVQHMKEQPPTKEATPAAVPAVDDAKLLPALEQLRSSQTAVSEQVENLRQMMADLTATEKQGSAQSSSSLAALEEALHRIDERLASAAQAQQQQQQHISAAPSPPPAAPVVVDLGPIQSSLDAIQRVLQQHRVAIEFLHAFPPVADAPTQPTTAQRSAWAELRAETSNRLAEMSQTLEDADRATSSSDGSSTTVVSQLREQLLALGSLLAKEKSLCAEVAATATARHEDVVAASSSPVSPADAVADLLADQRFSSTIASATTSAVEAAALPNAVRRAIADFEGDLRRELSALSSSQVSIREDLLNALRELSTNATSPPQTNDDDATSTPLNNNNSGGMSEEALTLLLEEHLTRITTELQSRSQPPLQEVAEAVRGATADLAAEVRAAKLDPAVIAEQVESHVAARVDDSLRRALGEQTMELKTLFPATTSAATPAAQTSTVESEGRLLEHITSILEKHRADTMKAATPPTPATAAATAVASPVAQQVKPVAATTITSVFVQGSAPYLLLHLVVYPLVLCAAVVLCAYYLFAGFLLVFVPKPGNNVVASTTTTTPPPTSSSPASPTTIEVVGPPLKSSRYVDRYM